MTDLDLKIAELEERLDTLVKTQIGFQTEVTRIRSVLAGLRAGNRVPAAAPKAPPYQPPEQKERPPVRPPQRPMPSPIFSEETPRSVPPPTFGMGLGESGHRSSAGSDSSFARLVSSYTESARADLEKFIGENLISLIGIIILILGVGIGAKYAIDNNLISPLTRIIIGYIFGFGLVGLAIRLKPKYLNFSAVLISGGMAIMYFVTYFAYALYGLMPQAAAFALMVLFTVFTVASALLYNRQMIAHIGLVGAYAVPFLLSNNSGNYLVLFAYMAIVNAGILAISIQKYWKPLFYTSSGFTWLIFGGWFFDKYAPDVHFYLALTFLAIFFATFYATKIVHGVLHKESDTEENLVAIFATAFIFYGFCFAISVTETGNREYTVFFTYLAAMSLAVLITSYRFYGRVLVYLCFPFTWLIFGTWLLSKYQAADHFYMAAIFSAVFFAVYYGATIIYRLITDDVRLVHNSGLLLTNSFIFYGAGYWLLDTREELRGLEGVLTAAHAAFHLAVAQLVLRLRSSAVDVIQVLTVLILTFATITIPVQFDGNYVTLIWSVEASLLFWFGRTRQIWLFEYFSYPLMLLAAGSLFLDCAVLYSERTSYASEFNRQPIANGDFITALVFVVAFAFIYVTNRDKRYEAAIDVDLVRPFGMLVAATGLFVLYNTFRIEIGNYFHLQRIGSETVHDLSSIVENTLRRRVDDVVRFNFIWQLNYTMFFVFCVCVINFRKVRSAILGYLGAALSIASLFIFATAAMYVLTELRIIYLTPDLNDGYLPGLMNIAIRYVTYGFAAILIYALYRSSHNEIFTERFPQWILERVFDLILYLTTLIAASFELVDLMAQFRIPDGTKLGLSILWGTYALALIVIGIAFNKKQLRIGAIVLLAVTLAKLFLYDIAELDTIPKTILFVTLGITMLVVSFLYNKYKALIFPVVADDD